MTSAEITGSSNQPPALSALAVLGVLAPEVRDLVAASFVPARYEFGETIVATGDAPDGFYVICSGMARVVMFGDDGEEVSLGLLRDGDSFGEEGLLEGSPRTATVRAASDVQALRLDAPVFGALVRLHPSVADAFALQQRARRLANFLRVHSAFSRLPAGAIMPMLQALEVVELAPGELAMQEGDPAGPLFIVEDGRLRAFQGPERSDIGYLRSGDFFGELSLYLGLPRAATVEALEPCRLLRLDAGTFGALMAEHDAFRQRVEERVTLYERGRPAHVPLDFAELLPTDAIEAALVEEPPEEVALERGVALSELGDGDGDGAAAVPRVPRWRRPPFPLVRQLDEMDCGAACVAMVCRYYGREVAPSHIRMAVGTGADGTSLRGLQRGGEHVGLEMRSIKASKERLDQLPLPAIVHWGGNHWVVLYAVDGERIYIADPSRSLRRVTREDVAQQWSGYAALPTPTPRLAEAPLGKASARWLVEFIRPHRRALALGLALAFVAAGLEMLFPVLTQQVVDHVLLHRNYGLLYELTGAMVGLLILSLAVTMVQRRMLSRIAVEIDVQTLDHITGRMLGLPMSYFESRRTGDIDRRLDGVRQIRRMVVQGGLTGITAATQFLVALVIMLVYSPLMGGLFVLTVPLYALLMRYSSQRVAPTFESLEEEYGRFRSRQIDGIKGIATVKAMGAEEGMQRMLVENLRELGRRMFRSDFTIMAYEGVASVVTFLTVVVFLFIGALEVLAHHLTVGGLIAFNSLILLANAPLGTLLGLWDDWLQSKVLLGRVQDIFDYGEEQPGGPGAYRPVPTLEGRISVRSARFHYPQSPSAKILDGISVEIPAGSTVAIVGRSGSGKSTLVKCLTGLLVLTDGAIAYDGVDIRELRLRDLRRKIGYVLQEPYLFDDTIARNIAFGDAEPDLARVRTAAELADAADFVERLPLAYDTRIGESGMRLSGGQAQRISIARALYRRPPVLIFDEATSALDTESERTVKRNLDRMLAGRTAFIVAHRLSTIRDADLILVLERGRLVEKGTHEELIARGGLYSYLTSQQIA
ncbi:MAG: ATP-binding cassette, subfamily bacterial HlyB/CyaB [Solirubrobacteraceae bacterium]|nr:ATP-binding cassette, subfamily bacterial HlyB/CyaB [Solirubrobacteraceae bacterium]